MARQASSSAATNYDPFSFVHPLVVKGHAVRIIELGLKKIDRIKNIKKHS
jgi:hypothetical protein